MIILSPVRSKIGANTLSTKTMRAAGDNMWYHVVQHECLDATPRHDAPDAQHCLSDYKTEALGAINLVIIWEKVFLFFGYRILFCIGSTSHLYSLEVLGTISQ